MTESYAGYFVVNYGRTTAVTRIDGGIDLDPKPQC
jgi:hypothetical protein